jgi:hypothetical protein
VADRRRPGDVSDAFGARGKIKIRGIRAELFCVLSAVFVLAPFQALAQDVSPQTGPATPSIASTSASTSGGPPAFLAPAPMAEQPIPLAGGGALTQGTMAGSPQGSAQPAFLLNGAVDLAEGYTTNAQANSTNAQGSSGNSPDTFTRGSLALGMHYAGPRLNADFNYALTGYYYDHFHSLNELQNQLNLVSTAVLVPDHLFANVNAFATPTPLSRVGPISATQASPSNTNNSNVYGYIAEPVYQMWLGDYAVSQTSLSESQVFFSQPLQSNTATANALPFAPAGNSTSTSVVERITSTPYFGRVAWDLNGSYTDTQQTSQSIQQSQGAVDLAYALDRMFAVLATVGYGQFTASAPLTQNPSGPIALGGARFSYGPTFSLIAEAGVANNFPTYVGSLKWNVTPRFDVFGSLTDAITTPQANILNNLSTFAVSPEHVFYDSQPYQQTAGQALFPQLATVSPVPTLGLALDNSINRDQNAYLTFAHHDERTGYGLSFFGDIRNQLNVTPGTIQPNSWLYGVSFNATHQLRRDLTGYAGVSYSVASEFGGQDRIITTSAGLSYQLAKDLTSYLTASYLQRQSSGETFGNVPLTDFTTIIGIRRTFGP